MGRMKKKMEKGRKEGEREASSNMSKWRVMVKVC